MRWRCCSPWRIICGGAIGLPVRPDGCRDPCGGQPPRCALCGSAPERALKPAGAAAFPMSGAVLPHQTAAPDWKIIAPKRLFHEYSFAIETRGGQSMYVMGVSWPFAPPIPRRANRRDATGGLFHTLGSGYDEVFFDGYCPPRRQLFGAPAVITGVAGFLRAVFCAMDTSEQRQPGSNRGAGSSRRRPATPPTRDRPPQTRALRRGPETSIQPGFDPFAPWPD